MLTNTNLMNVHITPNPFSPEAQLTFANYMNEKFSLQIVDVTGKVVRTYNAATGNNFEILKDDLASGIYVYRLNGEKTNQQGKFVIQ